MSYGGCEPDLSSSDYSTLESIMEQGASQGQSIIVAAGDAGSTACYADLTGNTTPTSEEEELAVNYPASSAYVTALGGTEFPAADVASSNTTYWESVSGSDVVTSAKSYIPEHVWNDDSASVGSEYGAEYALAAGGGGISTLTPRPHWQSGVIGIPSGSYRLVPDISLDSSPENAGYLYCTSDDSGWSQGQQASCDDGFRDSATDDLTVAGGTSFAAPIFAGMLAIINQKENSTGQGLINSTLYTLAANSSTCSSAFHDITSGGNECTAGSNYCSSAGESKYYAGTGYDEASGLGSVDLNNLLTAWTAGSSASLDATTTSLSAATSSPASGANDTITITVAPESSSITTTPTGTLTIVVDGTTVTSTLALSSGSVTYAFSSTASGEQVIKATYSGDSTFASSTGSVTVDVGGSGGSSSPGAFTLSATDLTVAQGNSGTSTVTITSESSYAGTVEFTLSTSSTSLEDYGCYDVPNAAVSANSTVTTTLTIYTSKSDCSSASWVKGASRRRFVGAGMRTSASTRRKSPVRETLPIEFATVFAGLLLFGGRRRRTKIGHVLGCLGLALVARKLRRQLKPKLHSE
jgi:subtilase family serine protease